jgi:hypothetical protein
MSKRKLISVGPARLAVILTKTGKALRAGCSNCGVRALRRENSNQIEIYCQKCGTVLLTVTNQAELRRVLGRVSDIAKSGPLRSS